MVVCESEAFADAVGPRRERTRKCTLLASTTFVLHFLVVESSIWLQRSLLRKCSFSPLPCNMGNAGIFGSQACLFAFVTTATLSPEKLIEFAEYCLGKRLEVVSADICCQVADSVGI